MVVGILDSIKIYQATNFKGLKMAKNKTVNNNHKSDMANANKGGKGQNQTHAKNQGNRGVQLNPNNK